MPSSISLECLRESLEERFGCIKDPRIRAKSDHRLVDIITITIMAVLCGAEGWVAVETYGTSKKGWLEQFLELPNGIPSHDTFGRVFSLLNPEEIEKHFQDWVRIITEKLGLDLDLVSIDGKNVRGSYDRDKKIDSLQMVSAWSARHGLVLGQCAVDKKSNEITAIPVLLEQLDLKGSIITIDAMGTQKKIAQQIQAQKADYILTLKNNHQSLAQYAKDWFETHESQLNSESVLITPTKINAGHQRIEQRQFWQVPVELVFPPSHIKKWAGLKTLVVERSRRVLWNKETQSLRFFLSSLPPDFSRFSDCIRSHWEIENSLHWCLDVVFAEDASRIRKDHAPRNMSVIRRLALNLLRQHSSQDSLKMKRYKAALNNEFLLSILQESSIF
jgi:predicted transposase YbfD/YdcC